MSGNYSRNSYRERTYSDEQYKRWAERDRRTQEFQNAHSKQTEKVYKVNDLYIVCKSYLYDDIYKKRYGKTNQYGIQVWEDPTRQDPEKCLSNKWFNSPAEANEWFKRMKAECEI